MRNRRMFPGGSPRRSRGFGRRPRRASGEGNKPIAFAKMSGTGNDFILIDNRDELFPEGIKSKLARSLCERRLGVGADGLILLERPSLRGCDIRMRIFNPDGSEAEMCGNGSRCLASFAYESGAARQKMTIQTLAGPVRAEVTDGYVEVELTPPGEIATVGELELEGARPEVFFVNTGVPHAVTFVQDLEAIDVRRLGRAIRFHKAFAPAGTNADFVAISGQNSIAIRTYERGVEDETLACGTGAAASALVAAWRQGWSGPVQVNVRSGEKLTIRFEGQPPRYDTAWLAGAVKTTFRGEFAPDTFLV